MNHVNRITEGTGYGVQDFHKPKTIQKINYQKTNTTKESKGDIHKPGKQEDNGVTLCFSQ